METAQSSDGGSPAYAWRISFVAALGGFLFGYDWVVIGGAKPFFERYFNLHSPALSGWANSCALIGCLVGALAAGSLSDRLGRKRPLLLAALLFAATSIGNGLAGSFGVFVSWRILGGVAIGLAANLSPLYIAEVAPARLRGRLVSLNQLAVVLGIVAAQLANWAIVRNLPAGATDAWIAASWYGRSAWRWMFCLTAAPSMLLFLGVAFIPESPRWLAARGRDGEARAVLRRIGGAAHADRVRAEMERAPAAAVPLRRLLDPQWRRPLAIGVTLAVFQQWCGINVIFNYAEEIFRNAGYPISSVLQNIAWTGAVNVAFTFVALAIVDRGGRRPLLLFGAAGLAVVHGAIGWCYHAGIAGLPLLLLVLAAIALYAMSLAPVAWVVISEIFATSVRGKGVAVSVAALWVACFLLTYTFPLLNHALGPAGTFWLYAGICLLGFLFVAGSLPETKGRTLEEIQYLP